jgi:CMP-N,N'-diacetyllegionaminic acid synthase
MYPYPKILGIIPAREGSRGVIGKHTRLLGNKSLIEYTIQSALESKLIHKVALSTDCMEIVRIAKAYHGIEIPFLRPTYLAQDDTPTLPVIKHILQHFEKTGAKFDFVCLLQPTTPFRPEGLADDTINYLLKHQAESLVTIRKTPSKYNPYWSFHLDQDGRLSPSAQKAEIIPRRQELPNAYHRDGQIYLASVGMIYKDGLLNAKTMGFQNERGPDINIDTLHDWALAEQWIANES